MRTFYCHECQDYHAEGQHLQAGVDPTVALVARIAELEATLAAIRKKAADRKKRYRDRGKDPF